MERQKLSDLMSDICVTAYGWRWGDAHDQLYDYIIELLKRFREDIYGETEPMERLQEILGPQLMKPATRGFGPRKAI